MTVHQLLKHQDLSTYVTVRLAVQRNYYQQHSMHNCDLGWCSFELPGSHIRTAEMHLASIVEAKGTHIAITIKHVLILLLTPLKPVSTADIIRNYLTGKAEES